MPYLEIVLVVIEISLVYLSHVLSWVYFIH
jgi:hypothetical protein